MTDAPHAWRNAADLPGSCSCSQLDVEDASSIRQFARRTQQALLQRRKRLAVLVNNAGVMGAEASHAAGPSGQDRHLTANYMGPFLLTRLLLPAMGPGSRIVNVSSRAHYLADWLGPLHLVPAPAATGPAAPAGSSRPSGSATRGWALARPPSHWLGQYCRSKLAMQLFTLELRRRLERAGSPVRVFGVSPGFINTPLVQQVLPPLLRPAVGWLARTPAQGARTVLFAATSPELAGRSVLFMHDSKDRAPSAAARDEEQAGRLWACTERLVAWTEGDAAAEGSGGGGAA